MRPIMTLLRGAAVAAVLVANTAYAGVDGLGYQESKDEMRFNNYVNVNRLKFDLDLFKVYQKNTRMYGISGGLGYAPIKYKYFRLYILGHGNAGITSVRNLEPDVQAHGAAAYYDAGIQPTIVILKHLCLNLFLGNRWQDRSSYLNIGDLNMNGNVSRLGVSLEF